MQLNSESNRSRILKVGVLALLSGALPTVLAAQYPPLTTPQPSPHASIEQTVGITKIAIDYSRPLVKGRKVWGELVPYGQVWRAGANVNTIVSFSTPVSIQGHALEAGRYGLHTIPTEKDWTVILSKDADQWGSFSYDEKRDALRFQVTPAPGLMTEALQYTINPLSNDSADIVLNWEKLQVAIPVKIDTKAETIAALHRDLTGLAQFFWQPWNAAANYAINNSVAIDDAERWAQKSIDINENFINTKTKAKLLRLKGENAAADALVAKALGGATEQEVNQYGYELLGEGKRDEAIAAFRKNVKDHPQSWNVHDSLGETLVTDPKTKAEGVAEYRKALSLAPAAQKARIEGILAKVAAPAK
jgi:hypothetical protein